MAVERQFQDDALVTDKSFDVSNLGVQEFVTALLPDRPGEPLVRGDISTRYNGLTQERIEEFEYGVYLHLNQIFSCYNSLIKGKFIDEDYEDENSNLIQIGNGVPISNSQIRLFLNLVDKETREFKNKWRQLTFDLTTTDDMPEIEYLNNLMHSFERLGAFFPYSLAGWNSHNGRNYSIEILLPQQRKWNFDVPENLLGCHESMPHEYRERERLFFQQTIGILSPDFLKELQDRGYLDIVS